MEGLDSAVKPYLDMLDEVQQDQDKARERGGGVEGAVGASALTRVVKENMTRGLQMRHKEGTLPTPGYGLQLGMKLSGTGRKASAKGGTSGKSRTKRPSKSVIWSLMECYHQPPFRAVAQSLV